MIELLTLGEPTHPALISADTGETVTYHELRLRVAETAALLARATAAAPPGILFLGASNTVPAVVIYLASLEARLPVCLLDLANPNVSGRLLAAYGPAFVAAPPGHTVPAGYHHVEAAAGYGLLAADSPSPAAPHPDLALLLTTSGSTGDPKLVRLSRRNLLANARSIIEYLGIDAAERAIQSLPVHYSFGLSVLHSHLLAGAAVLLTQHSFITREFWTALDRFACTSFAGVPYMYETLHRLRFDPARYPSLRTMTQAGGALRPELIQVFHQKAARAGARFFVMYGQTEATARISYVPPDRLACKTGSIGVPIPNGELTLEPVPDSPELQELVYRGPNVMLGYATSPACLALGDEMGGALRTGDLGRVDADGFFYISGRLKRFAKLFGRRINLEDIEHEVEAAFPVGAIALDTGDHLTIQVEGLAGLDAAPLRLHLAHKFEISPKAITIAPVAALPMTSSGKKDYRGAAESSGAAFASGLE